MKALHSTQKTFHVFKILTKTAMIFLFVWAVLAELGLLCVIVWYMGGNVPGINHELLYILTQSKTLTDTAAILLNDAITTLLGGILLTFARRYLKSKQQDGTAFTKRGTEKSKRPGTKVIVIFIVAIAISEAVFVACELPTYTIEYRGSFLTIPLAVVLILCHLIFRRSAEPEEKSGNINSEKMK